MTRIVNSGNATELAKTGIVAVTMVDLNFASGHVYANDGATEIVYGGNTYVPVGVYGGVDTVEEELDIVARPVKLSLSGVPTDLLSKATTEVYQNRQATIYLALVDGMMGTLVANPEIVWDGRMDYMEIEDSKGAAVITLNCEHRLRREPRIARYTDADQQLAYPGDTGMQYQQEILGFNGAWGNASVGYDGPRNNVLVPGLKPMLPRNPFG